MTCDVHICPRCGGTHNGLAFAALAKPGEVGGVTMTHWGTCPTTGEPITLNNTSPVDKSKPWGRRIKVIQEDES